MRPEPWSPPIDLSKKEQKIVKLIKRAKLFVFLREIRHLLFDEAFQQELSQMYAEAEKGHPPVPPAQLALTVILQAYTKASDAEAIEALTMDRRWQLVLDCLDCEVAPFSQATLVRFRQALIIHQLDRRLIERTVELAQKSQKFGSRQLRAALDSSPLWGAAKVEDTYNLLGHALKKALSVIARQQGRELIAITCEMEADLLTGSSLKAALDLNWSNPDERNLALGMVLGLMVINLPNRLLSWIGNQEQSPVLIRLVYLFVREAKCSFHQRPVPVVLLEKSVPAVKRGVVFRFTLMRSSLLNYERVN